MPVVNEGYLGAAGTVNWDYCTCVTTDTRNSICSDPKPDLTNVANGWRSSGALPSKLKSQPKEPLMVHFPSSGITASVGATLDTQSVSKFLALDILCDKVVIVPF